MKIYVFAALMCMSACATNRGSDVVTAHSTMGKVVYGTIMSSRPVTMKEHDTLSENTIGGLSGGVVGGIAGSGVGKGTGQGLATAGAAIAGAVLGAYIQDQLGTSQGFEYIVQLDEPKRAPKVVGIRKTERFSVKKGDTVAEDIQASVIASDRAADALAIVQQDAQPIPTGTHVMVVIRDDGTRITPMPPQP